MYLLSFIINNYYPTLYKSEYDKNKLNNIIIEIKNNYDNVINDLSIYIYENYNIDNLYENILYKFNFITNKNVGYIYSNYIEKTEKKYVYNPLLVYISTLETKFDLRILELLHSSINQTYYSNKNLPIEVLFKTLKSSNIIYINLCKKIIEDDYVFLWFVNNFYYLSNNCKTTIYIYIKSLLEICKKRNLIIYNIINYRIIKIIFDMETNENYSNKYNYNYILTYVYKLINL